MNSLVERSILIATFIILASVPAAADPRSEALAGISRCMSISDDRVFLDCIYGAAQPLRAALGLPPAPESQIRLVPPGGPGNATPQAPAMARMPPPQRNEGFLSGVLGSGKPIAPAQRMASYAFNNRGIFTVTLADGEIWRQVEGDGTFAHWHGPASAYLVILRNGAFGSSNLQVQGETAIYKVERAR